MKDTCRCVCGSEAEGCTVSCSGVKRQSCTFRWAACRWHKARSYSEGLRSALNTSRAWQHIVAYPQLPSDDVFSLPPLPLLFCLIKVMLLHTIRLQHILARLPKEARESDLAKGSEREREVLGITWSHSGTSACQQEISQREGRGERRGQVKAYLIMPWAASLL